MTEPKTYTLDRITDLLQVPLEKRERCLQELLLALALHELAGGSALESPVPAFTWTDDDIRHVELHDTDGKPVLYLNVTKENAR